MTLAASPILANEPTAYIPDSRMRESTAPRLTEAANHGIRIGQEILIPILESEDLAAAFQEKWEIFKKWRGKAVKARFADSTPSVNELLKEEDSLEEKLRDIIADASGKLGPDWKKPLLGAIHLRKIVRESVLPHWESWPQDSGEIIADRMALNELCLACVLHHLKTGAGQVGNAQTLAVWSYHYAEHAYAEAGLSGKDYIPGDGSEPE